MDVVVLDSGALSAFAGSERAVLARLDHWRTRYSSPFLVPAAVLVESTIGVGRRDATVNRLLRGCEVVPLVELIARRAAMLRHRAQTGSPTDACVVATAEILGGGIVLTDDLKDFRPLAECGNNVEVFGVR